MSKNMLTIMKKEFARFFGDKRMVFTTLIMPGLIIYIMYSFMGNGFSKQFTTADDYVFQIDTVNLPDSFAALKNEANIKINEIDAVEATKSNKDNSDVEASDTSKDSEAEIAMVKKEIENQETDLLVIFPEDFDAAVEVYDSTSGQAAPQIEIYYNSVSTESGTAYNMIFAYCDQYESELANKFDVNVGSQDVYDMATKEDTTAEIFSMLLPMLMMVFLFSGCMAIAPEAIAGEKERGTMATLLVTPMKRSELAIGKILSLSVIGLLSGVSSFLGTMLSIPKMMGGMTSDGMDGMSVGVYKGSDYVMLLFVILSTVLVIIGLISILSALAKSIKEASTAVTPLMIVVMVISITSMLGDGAKQQAYWYLIPVYNSVQCMTGIFSFTIMPMNLILTIVINIVYTLLMVGILTKIFDSEKIMYS